MAHADIRHARDCAVREGNKRKHAGVSLGQKSRYIGWVITRITPLVEKLEIKNAGVKQMVDRAWPRVVEWPRVVVRLTVWML